MGAGSSSSKDKENILNKEWVVVAYDKKKESLHYITSQFIAFSEAISKEGVKVNDFNESDKSRIYQQVEKIVVKKNKFIYPLDKKEYTINYKKDKISIKLKSGEQILQKIYKDGNIIEWNIKNNKENNKENEDLIIYWINKSKYSDIMFEYSKINNSCKNKCSDDFSSNFKNNIIDILTVENQVTSDNKESDNKESENSKKNGGRLRQIIKENKKNKNITSKKKKRKRKNSRKNNK